MKKYFILLLTIYASGAFAQNSSILKGTVRNTQGGIEFANVVLLNTDSTMVSGATTGHDGQFTIDHITHGVYIISTSFLGYETLHRQVEISSGVNHIADLILRANTLNINEVTVTSPRSTHRLSGNKLITTVSGSSLESVGSALEVLNYVPGVITKQEKVNVFGKGTPLVYINNRRVFNHSELSSISSSDILSVELIRNPGARYGADVSSVLVIKTKRERLNNLGLSASEELRVGKYLGHKEIVNLSYSKNKLNLFSTYYRSQQKQHIDESNCLTLQSDTLWQQNIYTPFLSSYTFQQIRGGFDWQLTEKQSFGAYYIGYFDDNTKSFSNSKAEVFADNILFEEITSSMDDNDEAKQHVINAFYKIQVNEKLNFQFDADYANKKSWKEQANIEKSTQEAPFDITLLSRNNLSMLAGKLNSKYKLNKNVSFEFGGEWNKIIGDGFMKSSKQIVSSNEYTNEEEKKALFFLVNTMLNTWQLDAGVRYEDAYKLMTEGENNQIVVDNKNWGVFPNISLSGKINNNAMLAVVFNSRVKRPSFSSLNSNNVYINRFLLQQGNPYLQETFIYNASAQVAFKAVSFSLEYSYEKNPIVPIITEQEASRSKLTYSNFNKYQSINGQLIFQPKIEIWKPKLIAAISKPLFEIGGQKYNTLGGIVRLNNTFSLPRRFNFMVDYNYQSNMFEYSFYSKQNHELDISISKRFFEGKLDVMLQVNDLFNWQENNFLLTIDDMELNQFRKEETRYLRVKIQYNFNKYKRKYQGKNASPSDINRM